MSSPPITPKTFPYRRKWTKVETDEITARYMKIADAMTDAVGPAGQVMYVDPSSLHNLAFHLALAGCQVVEELAYIVPVLIHSDGAPVDFHDWKLKSEYQPAPPNPDEVKRKAEAAAETIKRQLPPDVRAELIRTFIDEYKKATTEGGPDDDLT